MTLLFAVLTKNDSFRSYSTFDYLLRAHILNINKNEKTFKNEQRNRDDAAKKRANTSGVGESNNYYEDIYL